MSISKSKQHFCWNLLQSKSKKSSPCISPFKWGAPSFYFQEAKNLWKSLLKYLKMIVYKPVRRIKGQEIDMKKLKNGRKRYFKEDIKIFNIRSNFLTLKMSKNRKIMKINKKWWKMRIFEFFGAEKGLIFRVCKLNSGFCSKNTHRAMKTP